MNNETVCAIVVTFNRKKLLLECLEALLNQTYPLNAIYILDNASTDGTPELLKEKGFIKNLPPKSTVKPWEHTKDIKVKNKLVKIHYVKMNKNTGGAGGFHEGIKRAFEKGYNWLWVMDDDAEPFEDTLSNLLEASKKNNLKAIAPVIINKEYVQFYHHKQFDKFGNEKYFLPAKVSELVKNKLIKIKANAFVGLLINRDCVEKVGFPNKCFFIWGDDTDYTLRISKECGLYLYTGAFIKHKDGNYSIKKEIKGTTVDKNNAWKVSFGVRNTLYIRKHYFGKFAFLMYIFRNILSFLKLESINIYPYKIKGVINYFLQRKKLENENC